MSVVLVGGRIIQKLREAMQAYPEENSQTERELVRDGISLPIEGKQTEPTWLEQRMKRLENQMRKCQQRAME